MPTQVGAASDFGIVRPRTPSGESRVDEHVQRTAEFLARARQLRQRHNAETERLGGEADAVIYLVGQVARATDEAILDEFQNVTGGRSRALNVLGILAKIDLHPEILDRRNARIRCEVIVQIMMRIIDTVRNMQDEARLTEASPPLSSFGGNSAPQIG